MTPHKPHVFFDLDGTLTDSGPGIINSLRYMIEKENLPALDEAALQSFIGPPLDQRLREVFSIAPAESARYVEVYREYYTRKGIFENQLYPGIEELLNLLRNNGFSIYLATSKPLVFARQILDYFHISDYFTAVQGVQLGPDQITKAQVISLLLEENHLSPQRVVMVGDRKYDILGAKENTLTSIGVLYGYGSPEELEQAGADFLAKDVPHLQRLLLSL